METQAEYNVRKIDELPAGLERAILRVLEFHVGRREAIARPDLVSRVAQHGFKVGERVVRMTIQALRKDGHPICSTGGEDGGYWLAANWGELEEYLEREVRSRALDLLEQEKALKAAGEKRWGRFSPGKQVSFL